MAENRGETWFPLALGGEFEHANVIPTTVISDNVISHWYPIELVKSFPYFPLETLIISLIFNELSAVNSPRDATIMPRIVSQAFIPLSRAV